MSSRRDKLSLGHEHLERSGKVTAQEVDAVRLSAAFLGDRADKTQITTSSTAVIAHGRHGVITTVALTTLANAEETFTFTNTYIGTNAVILLSAEYDGQALSKPTVASKAVVDGSCSLVISNPGTAALNGLAKIHYLVLGAAPSL